MTWDGLVQQNGIPGISNRNIWSNGKRPRGAFYLTKYSKFRVSRYENLASCACILNSKSAAPGPIWLKFGQIVVRCVTYKTVSANFNSSFHFKVIAYFSLAVAIISHPRIYLLVKIKRTDIPEI